MNELDESELELCEELNFCEELRGALLEDTDEVGTVEDDRVILEEELLSMCADELERSPTVSLLDILRLSGKSSEH